MKSRYKPIPIESSENILIHYGKKKEEAKNQGWRMIIDLF